MPRIIRIGSADTAGEELADGKEIIINPGEISDTPEEPDPYAASSAPNKNTESADASQHNSEEKTEHMDLSSVSDEELLEEVQRRGLAMPNHDEKEEGNNPIFILSLYNLRLCCEGSSHLLQCCTVV